TMPRRDRATGRSLRQGSWTPLDRDPRTQRFRPLARCRPLATLPLRANTGVMRRSAFVVALAGIASLVCGCGSSVDDPASAAWPRPPVTIGVPRTLGDH